MINFSQYVELQKWYDVVLPPYNVFPLQLSSLGTRQVENWGHRYLKARQVYSKTKGEGVAIAILDTAGTFADHPDLAENSLEQYARNFTNSDTLDDIHGHGTHCAGIAAAVDNDQGIIGVAPGAKLIPIKVLNDSGSGSYQWIANGIKYAADLEIPGIDHVIISMSLGGSVGSTTLHAAVEYAHAKGVDIIAAAGNSYRSGQDTVGYPGKYPQCITVGSHGESSSPSRFSSAGSAVDVSAPGERIYSTHKDQGYAYLSGTSMATPFVAGVIALLRSEIELGTPDNLQSFLKENAQDIFNPGFDKRTGYGTPIIPVLFDQDPNEPDQPDEPKQPAPDPDPTPPDEPSPTPRPKSRSVVFHFIGDWHVRWHHSKNQTAKVESLDFEGDSSMEDHFDSLDSEMVTITEMVVELKTKEPAIKTFDMIWEHLENFWQYRGLILPPWYDGLDAAKTAGYFTEIIFKHSHKLEIRIKHMKAEEDTYPDIVYHIDSLE